jgi:hypothetical protein
LESLYINNCKGNIFTVDNSNNDDLESHYGQPAFNIVFQVEITRRHLLIFLTRKDQISAIIKKLHQNRLYGNKLMKHHKILIL